jgi:hypothetical protein
MSDSESSAPSKGSSDDQHDADFQPPQAKRTKFIQSSASGNSIKDFKPLQSLEFNLLGSYKYAVRGCDDKIKQIIGIAHPHKNLVTAAYADATWKKIFSAYNSFLKFCVAKNFNSSFPIDEYTLGSFIDWATFENRVSPSTISAYISHLRLIHKLKGISTVGCDSFLCKTQIRGAENLQFYKEKSCNMKKVMTLPLLRILGHELANSNWTDHSKLVVWSTYTVAFMGSFRLGEILARSEKNFNAHETLLWTDVKFMKDGSIQIHNKIPKTRTKNGEYISLFPFPHFGCCPIAAISKLKSLSFNPNQPVFSFDNGTFLTRAKLNKLIFEHLSPHIGSEARFYSAKSFRAALPSALASNPHMANDATIKKWGRWNSKAFERYTRLSHKAKEKLFTKFTRALTRSFM